MTSRRLRGFNSGQSDCGLCSGCLFILKSAFSELDQSIASEHAANADFLGFASDRVINLLHAQELQDQHPVAEIVEHEDQVIVVLERLAFHSWDRFHVILGFLIIEPGNFVLHEASEFHVERRIAFPDGFNDPLQIVLVQFGQFRKSVVCQQVCEFLRLAFVILVINRDHLGAHEQGGFESAMTAHNQTAAVADGDRRTPALFLDDGSEKLYLMGAMLVRVHRVGQQLGRINQGIMGTMDFETHAHLPRVNLDKRRGDMRG